MITQDEGPGYQSRPSPVESTYSHHCCQLLIDNSHCRNIIFSAFWSFRTHPYHWKIIKPCCQALYSSYKFCNRCVNWLTTRTRYGGMNFRCNVSINQKWLFAKLGNLFLWVQTICSQFIPLCYTISFLFPIDLAERIFLPATLLLQFIPSTMWHCWFKSK